MWGRIVILVLLTLAVMRSGDIDPVQMTILLGGIVLAERRRGRVLAQKNKGGNVR